MVGVFAVNHSMIPLDFNVEIFLHNSWKRQDPYINVLLHKFPSTIEGRHYCLIQFFVIIVDIPGTIELILLMTQQIYIDIFVIKNGS
jgi:hypothetical protein